MRPAEPQQRSRQGTVRAFPGPPSHPKKGVIAGRHQPNPQPRHTACAGHTEVHCLHFGV
ncbi:hypothetical protein SGPA1_22005 [Streptomyces misionensis JCM 4497]